MHILQNKYLRVHCKVNHNDSQGNLNLSVSTFNLKGKKILHNNLQKKLKQKQ